MKKRNKDTLGAQYRQRPPQHYLVGVDVLTGKQIVKSAVCKCCKQEKVYSEFYWVKDKGNKWKRKPICVECWNKDTHKRTMEKGYHLVEYQLKSQKEMELSKNILTLDSFLECAE